MEEVLQHATELQTSANVTAEWNLQYVERGQTPTDVEPAKTTNPPCYKCGKIWHFQKLCFYKHQKCSACKKYGHIAKMCKATISRQKALFLKQRDRDSRGKVLPLVNLPKVKPCVASTGYMVDLLIGEKLLAMKLDTGASVFIILEET